MVPANWGTRLCSRQIDGVHTDAGREGIDGNGDDRDADYFDKLVLGDAALTRLIDPTPGQPSRVGGHAVDYLNPSIGQFAEIIVFTGDGIGR